MTDDARALARALAASGAQVRINLACGSDVRPQWLNFDIVRQWPNSPLPCDVLWDARSNVIPLDSGSVDEIVAGYLLLHVPYRHHDPLVSEMFRVLKPGGRLEVGEVDMPLAMQRWIANPYDQSARDMVFGEQGDTHGADLADYDKHCAGHSAATLCALLKKHGFYATERVKIHAPEVWYEMTIRAWKP